MSSHQTYYSKPLTREQAFKKLGLSGDIENYVLALDFFIDGYEQCKKDFKKNISCNNETGRKGILALKLKDLEKKFLPDLHLNHGHMKDRLIVNATLEDIYNIKKGCIIYQKSYLGLMYRGIESFKRKKAQEKTKKKTEQENNTLF